MAIKGQDRSVAPLGTPSKVDVTSKGKKLRRGVRVWPVGVSLLKSELYNWLNLTLNEDGSLPNGYCHFPKYDMEFFKQLTAEQLVTRIVKGYPKREWQKTRDRNEALDCRIYSAANLHGISLALEDISDVYRFAKAEIVLSDSWVLGDINACFAPAETIETGQAFTLNKSLLSDEQWAIQAIPIDERFLRSHEANTEGAFDEPVIGGFSDMFRVSCYDEQIRWPRLSDKHAVADAPQPIIVKTHVGNGQYHSVDGWHDHRHLDRPWRDISHIISRITYRQSVTSDPEPYSDQHITSQGVSEYLGKTPISNFEASDVLHHRGSVFEDAAYRYADGWHGYMHLNQPWNKTYPIVQSWHT